MAEIHENAEKDYIAGFKYQEIADKYNVSINTVKSWKKRYGWLRGNKKEHKQKGCTQNKEKGCTQNKAQRAAVEEEEIETCSGDELTEKMQLFCVFFVKTFNATKSYMKAYGCNYQTAAVNASKLLKKTKIKKYIQELKEEKEASMFFREEDLVQKYFDIAFADMRDFAELDDSGTGVVVNKDFDGTIVSGLKETKFGIEIKLNDRMKALEWLDKYFAVNPEAKARRKFEELKQMHLERDVQQEEDEKETYGAVLLAPVLEEEDESNMDTTTEAD